MVNEIPESLSLTYAGVQYENNPPAWFISCMLISMLPLYYIMIKHKDFFIYIFAPIAAFGTWGYMYHKGGYIGRNTWLGWCYAGIIRAVSGLCFGVIAWILYERLMKTNRSKRNRIFFTTAEVVITVVFFYVVFFSGLDATSQYCIMLLIPVIIALIFSEQSCLSALFRHKAMRYFAPLSLDIYLNQWSAMRLVNLLNPGMGYKVSVMIMATYTGLLCVLNFLIRKLAGLIMKKSRGNQT